MNTQNKYRSEYVNEYGEEWIFEYNPLTHTGILKGSDIDWQEYVVVESRVSGLLLNDGELKWLQKAWNEATSFIQSKKTQEE